MYGALSVIVLIAAALYFWRDAKPLLQRKLALAEKRVAIEQERVEVERLAVTKPPLPNDDPMPQSFIEWAMQESSEWAREDKLARMHELYARLRNWDKVRTALMAEEDVNLKSTF